MQWVPGTELGSAPPTCTRARRYDRPPRRALDNLDIHNVAISLNITKDEGVIQRITPISSNRTVGHSLSPCQRGMFQRRVVASIHAIERVASNRQIRRKTRHPANLRALERQPPKEIIVPPLKYTPTYVPEKVSFNGWSSAPETPLPGLPFHVKRTAVGLQLPVYRDYRNGRTRVLTILRRYKGNEQELRDELSKVCGGKQVSVRPGRLEVVGDYVKEIRTWLVGLGF
ncbi:hypothetical protein PsorP6_012700 [Peronosclerospora sorghi]|uniref:Uncharacterized protein n=1 Tax=Peronosclerospora sorghi TaxID=230839 RepID=A0ACC0WGS7_9STRA|nr:hypothetical protein PsorP6_012700 [Peronosclerospora sorghi]